MKRCTWQPLLSTDDVGYLHQMIVDNICEVISRKFIGTLIKHFIIQDITHNAHITTNKVIDMYSFTRFHFETYHILVTICNQFVYIFFGYRKRITHQASCMGIILEVLNLRTLRFKVLWRIKSNISLSSVKQLLDIFLIDITTFTLTIRTMITTKTYALVKLDAEPFERFDDIFFGTRYKTMCIRVFYSENQIATMLARK